MSFVVLFIAGVFSDLFFILEQYSLSHELRFQYINHADSIRVQRIDDVKEMLATQVCILYVIDKFK